MGTGTSLIQIRGLSKVFKTEKDEVNVLEDIDLDIMEGEIFGIIGMSGAGKSTLVRCLNFLEKPTRGTVYFDNQDLSSLTQKELYKVRQSMAMIFQQFNLLMQRNVLKNVCFPMEIAGIRKKEAEARALELLEMVGLSDKAKAYPSQLSGGQKQRVAIARALASNPKVILCDEATSALDPSTTKGVLALLKDINKRLGITVVIITHEMSVVEDVCQRVAIIDNRHIAEVGYVQDIFTRPATEAARRLVFPEGERVDHFTSSRCCRIVFDGSSSFEPVIANMVLEFRQTVNIIFANTKNIDGKAFGQIVIQLPEDRFTGEKMMAYLRNRGLTVEEVNDFV
jgi:D-methionine transport system ATP-binding protein